MKLADMLDHRAKLIRQMRRNELQYALERSSVHRLNFALRRATAKHEVQFMACGAVIFDQQSVMRQATWWWERLERIAARRTP